MVMLLFFISLTSFTTFEKIQTLKQTLTECSNSTDNFQGIYILETCEKGRFKIKIDKKDNSFNFNILDGEKSISKGKITIVKEETVTYISLGEIEGILKDNTIQIQNYGNSVNEYSHFTQCDDKYLTFKKSK